MDRNLTLGSLFDGSGGFPLGGLLCGIDPVFASEVEPFPIRVTTKRLPQVKHLGDINKINGATVPPVDIITGGFCCQDLSVAGKRVGLHGERSGLFFQVIRIIKEMRLATHNKYPKFAVLENVPGMYSSSGGADFLEVLNELAKIKNETLSIPMPKGGKWSTSGEIVGDGFSIGWRTLDAQFWGVAQRRRRCFLVVDFTGERAGKILFDESRLSRNSSQSFRPWQGTTKSAEVGFGEASTLVLNDQGGQCMSVLEDKTSTLRANANHPPCVMFENHSQDTRYTGPIEVAPTVSATYGTGGNNQPFVASAGFCTEHSSKSRGIGYEEEVSPTLRAGIVPAAIATSDTPKTLKIRSGCEGGGKGALIQDNKSATLSCNNDQTLFEPKAYGICSDGSNSMKSNNPYSGIYEADTSRTIDGNGGNPSCNQGGIAVVSLQGSMIGRKDCNGPQGDGVNEEVSFTLNTVDKHAVVYAIDRETYNCGQNFARNLGISGEGISSTLNAQGPSAVAAPTYSTSKASFFTNAEMELANTLVATDYKDPPLINDTDGVEYIVRRLTPLECCRLQGFPDFWCENLGTENPSKEEVKFWTDVFETHRMITGESAKPKTQKQIIKWLKDPRSDSAEYKMWGNGVALPCVVFVLSGIVLFTQETAVS